MTYTGYTSNIEIRMKHHRLKKSNYRLRLIHLEIFDTKKEATKREADFKRWKSDRTEYYKNQRWKRGLLNEPQFNHIIDEILAKSGGCSREEISIKISN